MVRSPLFPRWSDTALRVAVAVTVAGIGGAILGPMIYVRSPFRTGVGTPVDQPVQFDHRHHVQDDGIDCRYCHESVERSASAGIPATEVCMNCHSQVWADSPLLEPVQRSYFSGQSLPWQRVYQLPDFVYFHHGIHIARGFACPACHGAVDTMPVIEQASPLTMAWCLDCHRNPQRHLAEPRPVRSLTHCTTCHR